MSAPEQDPLNDLLSYKSRLVDENFTHDTLSVIRKSQKKRGILVFLATLSALLVSAVLWVMSGDQILAPVRSFMAQSPYLFTLAIVAFCSITFWSTQHNR
ncbi:hypothetical protein [Idiomarina sp. HP20-50]|uniref:hypothetical protein n=1 Tax=Idiomarina sp. HP20-50 TaxID=3070813 RepID=UPI00294AD143|nr:hypothetical protein [Idiomarina sp. HP20-50]MDV6314827.1 hypothetical protein [Idiomarina sp. HP20-50]